MTAKWNKTLAAAVLLASSTGVAQPTEPVGPPLGKPAQASSPPAAPPEPPETASIQSREEAESTNRVTSDQGASPPTTTPTPAPSRAATDASNTEIQELRNELDQLRAEIDATRSTTDSADTYKRVIEFYGFMDMGLQRVWAGDQAATLGTGTTRASTFVLGNANLYIDANPTQNWRALTELRLTNYPTGSLEHLGIPALGQSEQRSNTSVFDVNSPDPGWNRVNWGSIVLEQAWLQGTVTDWFGVRAGYWLTPFGIWNIDHGTPTLIGLTPPSFTRGRFYPQRQLGVQVVGHVTSKAWTFNYTAYISNGKTSATLDPTDDKAFGLRLTASTTRPFPMTFGLAGYTGRYSEQVLNAVPPLQVTAKEVVAYRQWDVGVDASLDIHAFRVRTELAVERIDYEAGKSELSWNVPGLYAPNRLMWGWFTIGAYRLPWLGLEPYLSCELFRFPSPMSDAIAIPGVGLNIHFNTEVQLKTQFTHTYFFDFDGAHDRSSQNLSMVATRLVIAY